MINLISLIHCFELVNRMRINSQKSCFVGVNSPSQDLFEITNALQLPIRIFPIDSLKVSLAVTQGKGIFGSLLSNDVRTI